MLSNIASIQPFNDPLRDALRGIERETLRVNSKGKISQSPHPKSLGSALTNAHITTDYSEALLELITDPLSSIPEMFNQLDNIHHFVYLHIKNYLWPLSMPCTIAHEKDIKIARYGKSNIGRMKWLYRKGLQYRYGKMMQVISGVHYNFSLGPSFLKNNFSDINNTYLAIARNFIRFAWILPYYFGASAFASKTFIPEKNYPFLQSHKDVWFAPQGTSLRLSSVGYQNMSRADLKITYNQLDEYTKHLYQAIHTPEPRFASIPFQLNNNQLQVENEYYNAIRLKQPHHPFESTIRALSLRGIHYLEIRSIDVNPFSVRGLEEWQALFLETFVILCLALPSDFLPWSEQQKYLDNIKTVAIYGKDLSQLVYYEHHHHPMKEILKHVCEALYKVSPSNAHTQAIEQFEHTLNGHLPLLSDQLWNHFLDSGLSFDEFGLSLAKQQKQFWKGQKIDPEQERFLQDQVTNSLIKQQQIEAADQLPFKLFVQKYLKNELDF